MKRNLVLITTFALFAFGVQGVASVFQIWINQFQSDDKAKRDEAFKRLSKGFPQTKSVLIRGLKHKDARVRLGVAQVIYRNWFFIWPDNRDMIKPIAQALASDSDVKVRRALASTVEGLGSSAKSVIPTLILAYQNEKDARVKRSLKAVLGDEIPKPPAVEKPVEPDDSEKPAFEIALTKVPSPIDVHKGYVTALKAAGSFDEIKSFYSNEALKKWSEIGLDGSSLFGLMKMMDEFETVTYGEPEIKGKKAIIQRQVNGPDGQGTTKIDMVKEGRSWKMLDEVVLPNP